LSSSNALPLFKMTSGDARGTFLSSKTTFIHHRDTSLTYIDNSGGRRHSAVKRQAITRSFRDTSKPHETNAM